ncbi:FtsX-like permease family protein [uncultured Sphingobacterium sp.]|uniref:ABC transporter permease n=1 Tax=uncultured Sphingobacterium sp. TaxID=182688 RepID=UPI003453B3B1
MRALLHFIKMLNGRKIYSAVLQSSPVAALGLFGLATYVTQQRTKEIGVRKVLGASTMRLLKLLSGDFIKLVFVAFVIATPVAWWAMSQWLKRKECSIVNENCPKSDIQKQDNYNIKYL